MKMKTTMKTKEYMGQKFDLGFNKFTFDWWFYIPAKEKHCYGHEESGFRFAWVADRAAKKYIRDSVLPPKV